MKTVVKLTLVISLFIVNVMFAQEHSTVSISKSTSVSSSNGHNSSRSSSVSVKSTNSSYKFRASFDEDLTDEVREYLKQNLKEYKLNGNKKHSWYKGTNRNKTFTCTLHEGFIKIYVAKNENSEDFVEDVEHICESLKGIINGD